MSEPTGYELDQDKFDKYVQALLLKCDEEGVDHNDIAGVFEVMRRWWTIMNDEATVDAYIAAVKTAKLQAEKAEYEAALAAIAAELDQ